MRKKSLSCLVFCLAASGFPATSRAAQAIECADCLTFDVNFVVLVDNLTTRRLTDRDFRREVIILNRHFRAGDRAFSRDGEKLINFRYKRHTPFSRVEVSSCKIAGHGRLVQGSGTGAYDAYRDTLFDDARACDDEELFDPTALNFYIWDSHSPDDRFGEKDSYGRRPDGWPIIFVDYERLGHVSAVEEHEVGHAFGLPHACLKPLRLTRDGPGNPTATNIMQSTRDGCDEIMGERNLGFTSGQVLTILENAKESWINLRTVLSDEVITSQKNKEGKYTEITLDACEPETNVYKIELQTATWGTFKSVTWVNIHCRDAAGGRIHNRSMGTKRSNKKVYEHHCGTGKVVTGVRVLADAYVKDLKLQCDGDMQDNYIGDRSKGGGDFVELLECPSSHGAMFGLRHRYRYDNNEAAFTMMRLQCSAEEK